MGKGRKSRDTDLESEPKTFVAMEQPKTVIHPFKFFGEPGDDVEKWLKSLERISKANGWIVKRQLEILPVFLSKRAAEFYDKLSPRQQSNCK